MQSGDLRNRVAIQKKAVTRDGFGQEAVVWADLITVWAAIEPMTGREFLDQKQERADVQVRIRIRHRDNVMASMRCTWAHAGKTKLYEINAVLTRHERNRETHLMCRELVDLKDGKVEQSNLGLTRMSF